VPHWPESGLPTLFDARKLNWTDVLVTIATDFGPTFREAISVARFPADPELKKPPSARRGCGSFE
jgi:hypothetical protein